jgi:hypothetical protein
LKLKDTPKAIAYERAKKALHHITAENKTGNSFDSTETGSLTSTGKIRLTSPKSMIRTVHYTIKMDVEEGACKYKIDSVYIKEKIRGGKTKVIQSEDLVKDMEVSGNVAIETEKQLNEIDMEFQKLISMINSDMKNNAKLKNRKNKSKA